MIGGMILNCRVEKNIGIGRKIIDLLVKRVRMRRGKCRMLRFLILFGKLKL